MTIKFHIFGYLLLTSQNRFFNDRVGSGWSIIDKNHKDIRFVLKTKSTKILQSFISVYIKFWHLIFFLINHQNISSNAQVFGK